MRSEDRAGRRHDLHLATVGGPSTNGQHGNGVADPAVQAPAATKLSAWEAAWGNRGGAPTFQDKRAHLGEDLATAPATNGHGRH